MKDELLMPFAPILIEATRSIGYSFETALADIIDNCIGKGATVIDVNFDSNCPQCITVIDNAVGMSNEELMSAMRYGSKSSLDERDVKDLGRFGLGLKTASLSQCRKLTVITKQGGTLNAAQWDLDHINTVGNWALKRFSSEEIQMLRFSNELDRYESGTIVLWENFDRMLSGAANQHKVFDEKMSIAQNHVALVFHRFLGEEMGTHRVKIQFNGIAVVPIDPFLSYHPATQPLLEQTLKIDNEYIKVKPYILPHVSKLSARDKKQLGDLVGDLRQNQGFYVYRNKRLIIWGTWFRLIKQCELNKLARVRVDIPNSLDSIWEIDIKKSTASLPDVIKKNLVYIVENSVGRSERVYQYRGRCVNNDDLQHIWNVVDNRGSFQYQINRDLPLYRQLENCLGEKELHYLNSFLTSIEDAFPYGDVYYRIAKKENSAQASTLEFEKAYEVGLDMISSLKNSPGLDLQTFLANLDKIDMFTKYPDVVKKLREEYKE